MASATLSISFSAHLQGSRTLRRSCPPNAAIPRRVQIVRAEGEGVINKSIKKEEAKVVDFLKAPEIDGKAVMCRCWKSGTFPYCDGKHVEHNKETGDNVGPLIVSKE